MGALPHTLKTAQDPLARQGDFRDFEGGDSLLCLIRLVITIISLCSRTHQFSYTVQFSSTAFPFCLKHCFSSHMPEPAPLTVSLVIAVVLSPPSKLHLYCEYGH